MLSEITLLSAVAMFWRSLGSFSIATMAVSGSSEAAFAAAEDLRRLSLGAPRAGFSSMDASAVSWLATSGSLLRLLLASFVSTAGVGVLFCYSVETLSPLRSFFSQLGFPLLDFRLLLIFFSWRNVLFLCSQILVPFLMDSTVSSCSSGLHSSQK